MTTTTTTTTTSSCQVHAIVAAGRAVPSRAGCSVVEAGDLAAVVSDPDQRPVRLRAAMEDHLAILEELSVAGPVLPLAFGFVAPDSAAVVDDLVTGAPRYRYLLQLVGDRHQYDLRVRYDEEAALRGILSGDRRMQRLAARSNGRMDERIALGEAVAAALEQRRQLDGGELREALEPLVAAARIEAPTRRADVHLALLAHPDAVEDILAAAGAVLESRAWVASVELTGPAPAFSFMGGP